MRSLIVKGLSGFSGVLSYGKILDYQSATTRHSVRLTAGLRSIEARSEGVFGGMWNARHNVVTGTLDEPPLRSSNRYHHARPSPSYHSNRDQLPEVSASTDSCRTVPVLSP